MYFLLRKRRGVLALERRCLGEDVGVLRDASVVALAYASFLLEPRPVINLGSRQHDRERPFRTRGSAQLIEEMIFVVFFRGNVENSRERKANFVVRPISCPYFCFLVFFSKSCVSLRGVWFEFFRLECLGLRVVWKPSRSFSFLFFFSRCYLFCFLFREKPNIRGLRVDGHALACGPL